MIRYPVNLSEYVSSEIYFLFILLVIIYNIWGAWADGYMLIS